MPGTSETSDSSNGDQRARPRRKGSPASPPGEALVGLASRGRAARDSCGDLVSLVLCPRPPLRSKPTTNGSCSRKARTDQARGPRSDGTHPPKPQVSKCNSWSRCAGSWGCGDRSRDTLGRPRGRSTSSGDSPPHSLSSQDNRACRSRRGPLLCAGCDSIDPTAQIFTIHFRNDLGRPVHLSECGDTRCRKVEGQAAAPLSITDVSHGRHESGPS